MAQGPFRADHVGSLPRPDRLLEARVSSKEGNLDAGALRALEDECVTEIANRQEELGFKGITDGEYRRALWHVDFLSGFDNVALGDGRLVVGDDDREGQGFRPQCMVTSGKITRGTPIQVPDVKYLASVVTTNPKACVPSPTLMHFRGGRDAVDKDAYPDLDGFYADVAAAYNLEFREMAEAGLRYLQIDDTNLAYLCDDKIRASLVDLGEDPDDLLDVYIKLINDSVAGLPDDMNVCLHMCRGNFGKFVAGGYETIGEKLFNELNVSGYFMEYDDERSGGFEPLRFLPKGKRAALGLVSTKSPRLESVDELRGRIDDAAKHADLDQLALCPQCGFGTGAGVPERLRTENNRPANTYDQVMTKLGRIVETAQAVWGEV